MGKPFDIDKLKASVRRQIGGKLFTAVNTYGQSRLDTLYNRIDEIRNSMSGSHTPEELLEIITKLRNVLARQTGDVHQNEWWNKYAAGVEEIAGDLEDDVVLLQEEERFRKLKSDSLLMGIAKFFKRVVRMAGKSRIRIANLFRKLAGRKTKKPAHWQREIPLGNLVRFHCLNQKEMIRKWVDLDQRIVLELSSRLHELLASSEEQEHFGEGIGMEEKKIQGLLEEAEEFVSSGKTRMETAFAEDLSEVEKETVYYLERVGTLERRDSYYSKDNIVKVRNRVEERVISYATEWKEKQYLLLQRSKIIGEFLKYHLQLQAQCMRLTGSMEAYFENILENPLGNIRHTIERTSHMLGRQGNTTPGTSKMGNELKEQSKELVALMDETRKEIQNAQEENVLKREAEDFAEQIILEANQLTKNSVFLSDLDLDKNPPEFDTHDIEWRPLVAKALKEQVLPKVLPKEDSYGKFLADRLEELDEIASIVEVSVDAVLQSEEESEVSGEDEDTLQVTSEALQRAASKLDELMSKVGDKKEKLISSLISVADTFSGEMMQKLLGHSAKDIQLLDARYTVRESARDWKTRLGARWARINDRLYVISRFTWRKIKNLYSILRNLLGFKEKKIEEVRKTGISAYLSETEAKIKELPYIYRRLFRFGELSQSQFYIGSTDHINYAKKAYDSWKQGFPATFAIIGEKGSGKSTLISLMIDEIFSEEEVLEVQVEDSHCSGGEFIRFAKQKFGLNDVNSTDGIVEAIKSSKQGKVIVLESLQNMYLRDINGYEGFENLLYVISETKKDVFWIISCSKYGWNFLDKTFSIGESFSHLLRCDSLDRQQIEQVIIERHKSTGYDLVFEPNEEQTKSRAYKKIMDREEETQNYLREQYFDGLHKIAEGNASIAMIFWIRSIRDFDDTHFYIRPLEVTSLELIQGLRPEVLFVLAAFLLHDSLNEKELGQIMQLTDKESRLTLNMMHTRGLLELKDNRYQINHLMYRQVVRKLKERNIIHLY